MHYGSRALGLGSILLLAAQAVAAQQQPKDLPEAPAAQQEADHKHDSSLQATFEVLGRRSVFFPDLAASPFPMMAREMLDTESVLDRRWLPAPRRNSSLPVCTRPDAAAIRATLSACAAALGTASAMASAAWWLRAPIGGGKVSIGRESLGLYLPKAWQTAISPRPSRPRGIRLVVTGCGLVSPLAAISSRSIGRRSSAACALRRLLRASAPIPLPLGLGHRRHRVCCPDLAVRGAIPA